MTTEASLVTFESQVKAFCNLAKAMIVVGAKQLVQQQALDAFFRVTSYLASLNDEESKRAAENVLEKETTFAVSVFLVYNKYRIEEKDKQTIILRKLVPLLRFVSSPVFHMAFHKAFTASLLKTVKTGVGSSHTPFDTLSYISAVANVLGEIVSSAKVISNIIDDETVFKQFTELIKSLETQPAYHLQMQLINVASYLVNGARDNYEKDSILKEITSTSAANERVRAIAVNADAANRERQITEFIFDSIDNREAKAVSFNETLAASTRLPLLVSGIAIMSRTITSVTVNNTPINNNSINSAFVTVLGICIVLGPRVAIGKGVSAAKEEEITLGWECINAIYCSRRGVCIKVETNHPLHHTLVSNSHKELAEEGKGEQTMSSFTVKMVTNDVLQATLELLGFKPQHIPLSVYGDVKMKFNDDSEYDEHDFYKVKQAFSSEESGWKQIAQSCDDRDKWSCYYAEKARRLMGDKSTERYVHKMLAEAKSKSQIDAITRSFAGTVAVDADRRSRSGGGGGEEGGEERGGKVGEDEEGGKREWGGDERGGEE